jgi:hypothetical protein
VQEQVAIPPHQVTDGQLIERLCQGQADVLDELYARYAKRLYVFCDNVMRATDPGPQRTWCRTSFCA